MVAEVVRLLGDTKNPRILTNPATEMLHSVALWGYQLEPLCKHLLTNGTNADTRTKAHLARANNKPNIPG